MARHLAVILVAVFGTSGVAIANGRYPASVDVRIHPNDDQEVVLATTFGLLLSSDGGSVFRWLCEDALGYSGTYDPDVELAADGTIYVTAFDGLRVTRDQGCTFTTPAELANLFASDIEIGPDGTVWAGAWNDTTNGLWRSTDGGTSFTRVALDRDGAWWRSVKVAPSDGSRMYVSGAVLPTDPDAGVAERALLYRSDDGGDTFVALSTATLSIAGDPAAEILAISPTDPNVLFVRVEGGAPQGDAVYRSPDGGANFTRVLEATGRLEAFGVRSDGSQVIAGMGLNGMRVSADGGLVFGAAVAQPFLGCLAERSDGMWLGCGANWEPDFMALGRSTDAVAWTSTFRFKDLAEPQPCEAGTVQFDVCEDRWFDVICPLGVTAGCPSTPADAGIEDAASVDARVSTPDPGGSGGCGGCGIAGLLIVLPWTRRWHRGRRA